MPVWKPPVSDLARRAAGDAPIRNIHQVRRETTVGSDLEAYARGQVSETRQLVSYAISGEILTPQVNDLIVRKVKVVDEYQTHEELVVTVATGTGYLAPVGVVVTEEVQQDVQSETVDSYDPTVAVETQGYVDTNPLNQPPVNVEVAPTQEVYIPPLDLPTQENLQAQYGEDYTAPVVVDYSNYEAQYNQTIDYPTDYEQQQSNLQAQYDGL